MEYAQLNNAPATKSSSLMEKCVEESNKLKEKKEAEQKKYFFDPFVNIYNQFLGWMYSPEYISELSKKISEAMSDNQTRILFFKSNYDHQIGHTTTYIDRYNAQDIFTTTKFGEKILIDVLREKLGDGFKVSWESNFIEGIFRIYISWNTELKSCVIS